METTKNTHTAIKTSKYSKVKLPMQKKEKALWLALLLTSAFTLIEIAGVWFFDSLALLSDAAHMFTDIAALVIALLAVQIGKRVADVKRTFGYYRFEILAAVFNAVILFLVAIYIFYEAYQVRAYAPLDEIAQMLGFPGKMGMKGNQVLEKYQLGEIENIRDYCETDVLNTYLVYLRFQYIRGSLTEENYSYETDRLKESLIATNKPHLHEFLQAWQT